MNTQRLVTTFLSLTALLLATNAAAWDDTPPKRHGNVKVEGMVARPGAIAIPEATSIAGILRRVGGAKAKSFGVEVFRPVSLVNVPLRFNLDLTDKAERAVKLAAFKIYPADRVVIGERMAERDETPSALWLNAEGSNFTIGGVWRPGAYRLAPGTTLRAALAIAGGGVPDSYLRKVRVFRRSERRVFLVNAKSTSAADECILEPGDHVEVPEVFFHREFSGLLSR